MEPRLPGVFFTILLIGSVLGPLLGGWLSDLTGRRRMLLIFYGASALTTILFLAPLGIVSTRGRARWLFDFEYLWEVYKPAAKRRWGYYTLPIPMEIGSSPGLIQNLSEQLRQ